MPDAAAKSISPDKNKEKDEKAKAEKVKAEKDKTAIEKTKKLNAEMEK